VKESKASGGVGASVGLALARASGGAARGCGATMDSGAVDERGDATSWVAGALAA
jgi:hypothetical protein